MNKYDSQEIVHVKKGELEYLEFKILNKYGVKNCITLRHGGVSQGEHESLNFRTKGTDKLENVFENLSIIRREKDFSKVYKATQAHTDKVIVIDDKNKEEYQFENLSNVEADGYIVKNRNIATLITTADCNPIIIYDIKNKIIANVHAGWKGVINKIYINAIDEMVEKFGTDVKNVIVCIGPSIRKCCFTSEEKSFKEKFTSVFDYEDKYYFKEENTNRFHIDLIEILKTELEKRGISNENIHIADICTRCNTKDFFSYREACQKKNKDYGTMATIVELN